jgi:hypothetical protein
MSDEAAAYGGDEEGKAVAITPDAAFIESDGHQVNGLKLQPYTPERMWAADAMGLRYGHLSKAASMQFIHKGTYPGMEADVAIVIWLCSLKDVEEVRAARRDPDQAEDAAITFARNNNIVSTKRNEWWDAYKVFLKIMREVHAAYGEPKKKEDQKEKSAVT